MLDIKNKFKHKVSTLIFIPAYELLDKNITSGPWTMVNSRMNLPVYYLINNQIVQTITKQLISKYEN